MVRKKISNGTFKECVNSNDDDSDSKEYYYGRGDKFRRNADNLSDARKGRVTERSIGNFEFRAEMIRRKNEI